MATAYSGLGDTSRTHMIASISVDERNRRTIQGMVDGFAKQDIDGIMALIVATRNDDCTDARFMHFRTHIMVRR